MTIDDARWLIDALKTELAAAVQWDSKEGRLQRKMAADKEAARLKLIAEGLL